MTTYTSGNLPRFASVLGLLVAGAAVASASRVTLTSGTVIPIQIDQDLSSDHSMQGDTFTATVKAGYLGLPEGTRLRGVVKRATLKSGSRPGVLVLAFNRIIPPNENAYTIDGTPVALDSKSVTTGRNGRLVAKSGTTNKRLTYVGYGAGAGAVLALLGGGHRIVEDTAIGAALGYLGGALVKNDSSKVNNVLLKSGSSLGVLLHRAVSVTY